MNELFNDEIIDDNDNFKDSDAYSRLKSKYPAAFPIGVKLGKIKRLLMEKDALKCVLVSSVS